MPITIDPTAKLKIISLENGITVVAQFNPKEVQLDKAVPWQKQKKKGPADLEYTGGEPKTMSLELLFDGFELNRPIAGEIAALHGLTEHVNDGDKKRPPKVKVVWGPGTDTVSLPKFEGVVESVSVKYQMFAPDGMCLRATATVKLKEAGELAVGKKQG
jgi:hypothetical protein